MTLNISKARIIRERRWASRPASRSLPHLLRMVYLLGCAWTFASAAGCQLIMGDLPGRWDGGAEDDDAAPRSDASDGRADAESEDAGSPLHDAAQHDATEDAADAELLDTGSEDADSSPPQSDAGAPDADPTACDGAGEKVFYRDMDEDGYGDGQSSVRACGAPSGYVGNDDDCHDGRDDVHPGQSDFFAQGYRASGGSESFDYDCDGHEVAGPNQSQFVACSSGGLIGCSGGGYQENPERAGKPDPYCGSNKIATCGSGLGGVLGGCGFSMSTTNSPYVCH